MFWMIIGSILASFAGLGIYLFFLRKGEFDDEEDVKYQIFRDDPDS